MSELKVVPVWDPITTTLQPVDLPSRDTLSSNWLFRVYPPQGPSWTARRYGPIGVWGRWEIRSGNNHTVDPFGPTGAKVRVAVKQWIGRNS